MGTVIFTGANSSIAIPAVEYLLKNHADLTAVLTVRDVSDGDTNTKKLRDVVSQYPKSKVFIQKLDLAGLDDVKSFADGIAAGIANGTYPPLKSIICNAFYWNLVGEVDITGDGYEKTFQVNHISHSALVIRLLDHFGPDGGRVLLFSSDAHWPGKNMFEKIPPTIPADLDELAHPKAGSESNLTHGFARYANSKLAITSWMYALNRHIQRNKGLKVTAVAMNPGNIADSRALRTNVPTSMPLLQRFLIQPLLPVLRTLADPTMRTAKTASQDVIKLALAIGSQNERGFYTLLKQEPSSPESLDEDKQERLWNKTLEWSRIQQADTLWDFSSL